MKNNETILGSFTMGRREGPPARVPLLQWSSGVRTTGREYADDSPYP